ncbi:MAG: gliding motility-associated C-terminal domain-containing protein [Bacteroidota bacterium]
MRTILTFATILLFSCISLQAQVVADFTLPDTICVNKPVIITNLTTGGTDFYWSFCSGSTASDPIGSELVNARDLAGPAYITVAQAGNECYSFVSNHFNNAVTRFYHGHSFQNDPITSDTINVSMVKNDSAQGIQIRNDNGQWYGFLAADNVLLRMEFGTSLANNRPGRYPIETGASSMHGLFILKADDNLWYGVVSSSVGNRMYLITFGNSLANNPTLTDITQGFLFEHPGPLSLVQEDGNYYCFVVNSVSSSLSRGNFGSSLLNKPVWTNLGKVCGTDAMGIMLIRDCGQTNGFMDRFIYSGNILFRLLMPQGITGPASTQSMGNIGNLNKPQQFSEITRVRDTIYTFVCNQTSTTITRLSFITCTNSSIPSSTLYDPPAYTYDSAGIYNVRLTVNEGQPNQQNICKHIVVVDHPPINLGPDRTLCQGIGGYLDAGANCDTIRWSTGDTIRRIKITQPGTYWVNINKFGCWGSDTVTLSVYPLIPAKLKPDTAICQGQTYILNPGTNFKSMTWNTGDTSSFLKINAGGTYWVHTIDINNCPGADTVIITLKPAIDVKLAHDTSLCDAASLVLHAGVPGATYEWQDGSVDSLFSVTKPGVYWVRVSRDGCAVKDTSFVHDCSTQVYFPNAFSPNGDGKNDDFHPIGPVLYNFKMTIYDRWGQQIFTTTNQETGWDGNSKGKPCQVDVYSYIVSYELADSPGTTYKLHGNVTLIR